MRMAGKDTWFSSSNNNNETHNEAVKIELQYWLIPQSAEQASMSSYEMQLFLQHSRADPAETDTLMHLEKGLNCCCFAPLGLLDPEWLVPLCQP